MKKSIGILILGLSVLLLTGLIMFVVITSLQNEFVKSIRLQENGITEEKMEITGLNLKPGDQREYELTYSCSGGGTYDLAFVFKTTKAGGMEQYIVVELECGDRKVTVPFAEILEDERGIETTLYLDEKKEDVVYLRFRMPVEVGNEAQGTTTDFQVIMTAKHSKEEYT